MARKKRRHKVREHPRRLPGGRIIKVRAHNRGGRILLVGVAIAVVAGVVIASRSKDEPEPNPAPPPVTATPSG